MSSDRTWVDPKLVTNQTAVMRSELDRRWPGGRAQLRQRTIAILAGWREVIVRVVPESDADAECAVAGAYLAGEQPPIVAVAESLSTARRGFTALHELGHHLQQTTDTLVEVLLDQPDDGRALEELACNRFAADILIPDAVVARHIDDAGPTAHSIVSLWQDQSISASRAAVCACAAELLRSAGHVLLLDGAGMVTFGHSRGFPPVRRGSDQSGIALVRQTLADPARAHAGDTAILYRDGIAGTPLIGQAKSMGGFVVLVAVADHAPWENGEFRLPTVDAGPTAQLWMCGNCDHDFPAFGARCTRCSAPTCPDCGQCECPQATERLCKGCFLYRAPAMFDGSSDRCRDCA